MVYFWETKNLLFNLVELPSIHQIYNIFQPTVLKNFRFSKRFLIIASKIPTSYIVIDIIKFIWNEQPGLLQEQKPTAQE